MKEQEFEKIFKALANRRRLKILKYLKSKSPAVVGDIADNINLSFKATSKHLLILSNAGIVEKEQISLNMFYSISPTKHQIVSKLLSII